MEPHFYKTSNMQYLGESPVYICIDKNKIWCWDKFEKVWRDIIPLISPNGNPLLLYQASQKVSKLEIVVVTGTIGPEKI